MPGEELRRGQDAYSQGVLDAARDALELPDEAAGALLPVPGLAARAGLGVAAELAVHARNFARHRNHHLQPARRLVPAEIRRYPNVDYRLPQPHRISIFQMSACTSFRDHGQGCTVFA